MKILLIHQYFLEKDDPGGSRFNEMTKVWVKEGHQVTVLCGMLNYVTGKVPAKYKGRYTHTSYYEKNLRVVRSHVSSNYNSNFFGRLWAYFSFVVSSIYAGLFKASRHDIIVVTSPPLFVGITAYVISRLRRVPFIFEVRDLWPESAIDTGVITNKLIIKFAFWFESFVYKKARLINVLTPAFREKLVSVKNVQSEKVIFIPNAADFSLSDRLLKEFDVEKFKEEQGLDGKFVVTYAGAHGVANHLMQLLEAAELIDDQNVLIQFVGDGMEKRKLIEAAKVKKLRNVRFVDAVPKSEVFKYIIASDMGASVLKKVDTFKTIYSNKTFDYMACQRPVLLAIDGVSRELVESADCGIYAEPENARAIADAIIRAKKYHVDFLEKGKNGYRYAKENFDRLVLAKKYLTNIERAVDDV